MYNEESNKKTYLMIFIFVAIIIFVSFQLFVKEKNEMIVDDEITTVLGDKISISNISTDEVSEYEWTSSDESVVTVNKNGEIEAVSEGEATVTVKHDGKSEECTVKVESIENSIQTQSIELNKEEIIAKIGEKISLNYIILPSNATNKNVSWYSSNSSVAVVQGNTIITKGIGQTIITVATGDGNIDTCILKVESEGEKIEVPIVKEVESISFTNGTEMILNQGENYKLNYVISPSDVQTSVIWNSSDKNIITVSGDGDLKAKNPGSAIISVSTLNGKTATMKVTVKTANEQKVSVSSISLDQSNITLSVGKTLKINASINPDNATDKSVIWASSKNSVATVSNDGLVTAKMDGTCTITAKTSNGKTATVKVVVKNSNSILDDNNFLKTSGTSIVYSKNNTKITLRGFNLGVYLSRSSAFMPIDALASSEDELNSKGYSCINSVAFIQALEKNPNIIARSKKTGRSVNLIAKDLSYILYDNYITEEDFNMIAKTGANVVRLPFEYELFLYQNPNGTYSYSSIRAEAAFKRIDWVIEQCKKRGIYVILDLHIAPGKQNSSGWCGKKIEFFDNSNYKEAVKTMWVKIAERYKNEEAVAGYDLLNEPETGSKKLITFYDSIYSAIRKVDKNHIIIMEETCVFCGYDGVNNSSSIGALPNPSVINTSIGKNSKWENVVYSTHDYFYDKINNSGGLNTNAMDIRTSPAKIKSRIKQKTDKTIAKSKQYQVPYYIGEFSHLGSYNTDSSNYKNYLSVWEYAMDYYDSNNISYTPWTYKAGWDRYYGLIYYSNTTGKVNLEESTYEQLKAAFEKTSSQSMKFNKEYYQMFVSQWGGR